MIRMLIIYLKENFIKMEYTLLDKYQIILVNKLIS